MAFHIAYQLSERSFSAPCPSRYRRRSYEAMLTAEVVRQRGWFIQIIRCRVTTCIIRPGAYRPI